MHFDPELVKRKSCWLLSVPILRSGAMSETEEPHQLFVDNGQAPLTPVDSRGHDDMLYYEVER